MELEVECQTQLHGQVHFERGRLKVQEEGVARIAITVSFAASLRSCGAAPAFGLDPKLSNEHETARL